MSIRSHYRCNVILSQISLFPSSRGFKFSFCFIMNLVKTSLLYANLNKSWHFPGSHILFWIEKVLPFLFTQNTAINKFLKYFLVTKTLLSWVSSDSLQNECKLCLVYFKFLVAANVDSSMYLQKVPLLYLQGRENATYLILYMYKVPS